MTLWIEVLVATLAAFRLTRLITKDSFPPIKAGRDWILRRWPSEDAVFLEDEVETDNPGVLGFGRLRGTEVRVFLARHGEWMAERGRSLGELVTCPWCAGMYVSAAVAGLMPSVSGFWAWLGTTLALSAAVGLIATRLDRTP